MTNIRAVDPNVAWGLFQGWAAQALCFEPPGTVLTLVDCPALRRPKAEPAPAPRGPYLYPANYLRNRGHDVVQMRNGLWQVDRVTRTTFQLLDMINAHRRGEGMPKVELEDLKGIER